MSDWGYLKRPPNTAFLADPPDEEDPAFLHSISEGYVDE